MTQAHRTPEYFKNSRIIRRIVNARLKRGDQVQCIGCGWPISPDQQFDIGHIRDAYRGGDNSLENLGPQHRKENRSAGGRAGSSNLPIGTLKDLHLSLYSNSTRP